MGAQVCEFYSKHALGRHENLPKELKHLAWLSLDDADGQEYWAAMNLMGRYAAANQALIDKHIAKTLRAHVILDIESPRCDVSESVAGTLVARGSQSRSRRTHIQTDETFCARRDWGGAAHGDRAEAAACGVTHFHGAEGRP